MFQSGAIAGGSILIQVTLSESTWKLILLIEQNL